MIATRVVTTFTSFRSSDLSQSIWSSPTLGFSARAVCFRSDLVRSRSTHNVGAAWGTGGTKSACARSSHNRDPNGLCSLRPATEGQKPIWVAGIMPRTSRWALKHSDSVAANLAKKGSPLWTQPAFSSLCLSRCSLSCCSAGRASCNHWSLGTEHKGCARLAD